MGKTALNHFRNVLLYITCYWCRDEFQGNQLQQYHESPQPDAVKFTHLLFLLSFGETFVEFERMVKNLKEKTP